jgi:hypothetical protein
MVVVQQNGAEHRQPDNDPEEIDWDKKPLLDRSSFQTEFDTNAYLKVSYNFKRS